MMAMTATGKSVGGGISTSAFGDKMGAATVGRLLWQNRTVKQDAERRWLLNLEFASGNHWLQWKDEQAEWIRSEKLNNWDIRLTFNRILPAIEQRISRLMRRDPVWTVAPEGEDDGDRIVARTANQVMGWYWTDGIRMPPKLREALAWAMTTGSVCIRPYWNPFLGESVVTTLQDYMRPAPADATPDDIGGMAQEDQSDFKMKFGMDAFSAGQVDQKTGDIAVEIIPPFDIIGWPFDAVKFEDWRIKMVTRRRTHAEAAQLYGKTVEEIAAMAQGEYMDDFRRKVSRAYGGNSPSLASDGNDHETILEHEIYVPAGVGGWPNGRAAIVLGLEGEAVRLGDIANPDHRDPLFMLQEKPIPGKLWGTCTMDQLVPANIDLNLACSQQSNYRNRQINPTVVRIQGDCGQDKAFSNAPGKVLEVLSKEHVPTILERPELGNDHDKTIERNVRMMNDISGVSGVDLGSSREDSVKSGIAIARLQEQNDTRLIGFAEAVDECMSQVGSFLLATLREKSIDERIAHIIGEDNRLEVVKWSGQSLRPSGYGQPGAQKAMVRCSSFKNLPTTRPEVYALVQENTGPDKLFDPIKDRRLLIRLLGVGNINEAFDEDRIDESKAENEHDGWRAGRPVPPPAMTDNHQVHIERHGRWLKTPEFDILARSNPMAAQEAVEHYRLHRDGLAMEAIRPQYDLKIADYKVFLESQERAATLFGPGIVPLLFPAPMSMMMPMGPDGQPADGGGEPKKDGQDQQAAGQSPQTPNPGAPPGQAPMAA